MFASTVETSVPPKMREPVPAFHEKREKSVPGLVIPDLISRFRWSKGVGSPAPAVEMANAGLAVCIAVVKMELDYTPEVTPAGF